LLKKSRLSKKTSSIGGIEISDGVHISDDAAFRRYGGIYRDVLVAIFWTDRSFV